MRSLVRSGGGRPKHGVNGLDGGSQPNATARTEAEVVRDWHTGEHVAPRLDGFGKPDHIVGEGVVGPVGRGLVERVYDGGQRQAPLDAQRKLHPYAPN